jgi:hypothetical protein
MKDLLTAGEKRHSSMIAERNVTRNMENIEEPLGRRRKAAQSTQGEP